ncbi:MAG: tetratricopeptide repeat protein, partial [Muribaculaceae bacterium]|nr:tetratricopeptide repeat protein [Muribaculaceae bacterium]
MTEPDDRDILRERFKADLARPVSERYYSEDELITIFDSAGDYYDDYLRTEALLLGARLYPDSQALLARRAIFYSDRDISLFRSFIEDNPMLDTPLAEIMRLSEAYPDRDEACRRVEQFISTHRLAEDEEVIQFVRILHAIGLDKWLVDNMELIRTKVSYQPTLLYEVAVTAEESAVFDTIAIQLLEELTEMEAYAPEYWTLLAMAYLRHERHDDARTAIDYALAIDPDNVEALKARLHTFTPDTDSPEIDSLLDRLLVLDPADASIAGLAVLRAEENRDIDKLQSIIASLAPEVRVTRSIVEKAVQYNHPGLAEYLAEYYDYGFRDDEDWKSLAETAYKADSAEAVTLVLQSYEAKSGTPLNHDFLLYRILYRLRKYDVAIAMFGEAESEGTLRRPENLHTAFAMYVTMLLRLGKTAEAREAAYARVRLIDTEPAVPGSQLEKYGMRAFLA